MPNKLASIRLSKSNLLTIWTPDGHLTVALDRTAAQVIAAGLQMNAGVPIDEKQKGLARFSGLLCVNEVKEPVVRNAGVKLISADAERRAKISARLRAQR